ncbi:alpha/beta fold hydrolase [Chelatococcus sp. SYSU_G07232]|uniref:Alpha/beta fold hydrolase n=1 Tax=Chelatococcus albus TaxID=3047466 RepID=A0ABT7AL39_9HYPH|nr:alpha/beta fold hydrolase [Chelatococcus sp. SYSU_G07232]MDJ1160073.1 alpha/beta fold hydrolase [Chelatococcus sp. SYSU_G07232]
MPSTATDAKTWAAGRAETAAGPSPAGATGHAAEGDNALDRLVHSSLARLTGGLSPAALGGAYLDWATHLAFSPGKQLQLLDKAARKVLRWATQVEAQCLSCGRAEPCIEPLPQDKRFSGEAWRQWPFNVIYQGFLLNQQWWHSATTGVAGVTAQHEAVVAFATRQLLDMVSPSNLPATNPEVLERTLAMQGTNLLAGFGNYVEDLRRLLARERPVGTEAFVVGRDVAISPGAVVYRNRLIELIQYAPTTKQVRPEPVLIVPAWIMKYYILDLSPANSLVRHLTDAGFTVFMLSWKNPDEGDRDLDMEDYRRLGVMAALDAVGAVLPERKVHAVGYCLGGTLLAIAAAGMARDGDERLASITLFAAQTDFTEPGELSLFINESQIHFLEDLMWQRGYLDTRQMAGAFQLLRSNDLIWSYGVRSYLMGEREPMTDLMAWNADATRMPYRMHAQYLRHLFLDNDLAEGRFRTDGKPVALTDIRAPIFAVGAERDHVAPWRSTYKIHLLVDADVTYLLTSGGHNAGIVSEPGRPNRSYRVMTKRAEDLYVDPDTFLAEAEHREGSWWPEWFAWLAERSGAPIPAPAIRLTGRPPLGPAPGTYVMQP